MNIVTRISGARVSAQPKYTPAYQKQGTGAAVPQKCVIPAIVNNPPYKGENGALIEGGKVIMFITAWGKLADTCAKYLNIGKEFDCEVNVNSYESKVMDPLTHVAVLNSAGQHLAIVRHGFTMIPSSFRFGADSAAQIAKENRPLGWDGKLPLDMIEGHLAAGTLTNILEQAKQGPAMWQAKMNLLKNLVFTPGMREFGAALVVQATDAIQTAYAPVNTAAVAAATTEKTVGGFTLADLRGAGWTDEELMAGGYGELLPKKVPAPPSKQVPTPPSAAIAPTAPPVPETEVIDQGKAVMEVAEATGVAV